MYNKIIYNHEHQSLCIVNTINVLQYNEIMNIMYNDSIFYFYSLFLHNLLNTKSSSYSIAYKDIRNIVTHTYDRQGKNILNDFGIIPNIFAKLFPKSFKNIKKKYFSLYRRFLFWLLSHLSKNEEYKKYIISKINSYIMLKFYKKIDNDEYELFLRRLYDEYIPQFKSFRIDNEKKLIIDSLHKLERMPSLPYSLSQIKEIKAFNFINFFENYYSSYSRNGYDIVNNLDNKLFNDISFEEFRKIIDHRNKNRMIWSILNIDECMENGAVLYLQENAFNKYKYCQYLMIPNILTKIQVTDNFIKNVLENIFLMEVTLKNNDKVLVFPIIDSPLILERGDILQKEDINSLLTSLFGIEHLSPNFNEFMQNASIIQYNGDVNDFITEFIYYYNYYADNFNSDIRLLYNAKISDDDIDVEVFEHFR